MSITIYQFAWQNVNATATPFIPAWKNLRCALLCCSTTVLKDIIAAIPRAKRILGIYYRKPNNGLPPNALGQIYYAHTAST